jgi:hypothetical protein
MEFEKLPGGYWRVNSKNFVSKFEALKYATETDQKVEYIFFDAVWNSFNKASLGKCKLNDLYKKRAQQLRDEYDYLILYFSGGSDSYNVLRSFIDNDIKLDEICVKWPMAVINQQLYKPNSVDTTAFNYLSEWDYAIKPVLDSLSQTHPNIKITIVDWTSNYTPEIYSENLIQQVGPWNDVEMPMMISYSPSERFLLDKGKRVASIYGVDKPIVGYHENKWFMSFPDGGPGMGLSADSSMCNVEYFYWTPNMPEIAFEQAYAVCDYLENNDHLLNYFYSKDRPVDRDFMANCRQVQNDLIKKIIYTTWTGVFQAAKPISHDREDKQFWIFNHPELYKHRESFIDLNSLALTQIDSRFYHTETKGIQYSNKKRGVFKNIWTKWHFVKTKNTK